MAGLIVIAQQRRRSTIKRSGFPYTWSRWAGTAVLLLAVGVLRRWRWTFWLILVAFLAGAVRVPVAICSWSTPCQQMSQVGTSCCKL
jgi:hypothetical protein